MEQHLNASIDTLIATPARELCRAGDIARRYALGATLAQIGEHYDLSRERIRQIINAETPWTPAELGAYRKARAAEQAERERHAVFAWSAEHFGIPLSEAAATLQMDEKHVRRVLGRRARHHDTSPRKPRRRRSETQLLQDLREFHTQTGNTTTAAYDEWAKSRGVPGSQTMFLRFGSWNEATRRAGVKNDAPMQRQRRYSEADLWAAVVEAVSSGVATFASFDEWLRGTPGAPSSALVRGRLAREWGTIWREAAEVVNGCSQHNRAWIQDVSQVRDWTMFLDTDPTASVRQALAEIGPELSIVKYNEWAKTHGQPTSVTIMRRTGLAWPELMTSIGGVSVRRGEVRLPMHEVHAWINRFTGAVAHPTYTAYESWRKAHGAPSAATVSMRSGGWSRALELAAACEQCAEDTPQQAHSAS